MITPQSRQFVELFDEYRNGHLCMSGGVVDQPHKYREAMKIIQAQVKSE